MSGLQRQSRFERNDDVVVMKFGGTSVGDDAAIRRLIAIVQGHLDARPVVVVSALAKVTDQLLEAGQMAAQGHLGAALAIVREIYVRHEQLADSLFDGSVHSALDSELRGEFQALEILLHDLDASHQLDLKAQDCLLGFGEMFSSRLVHQALCQAGVNAVHADARVCIVTDNRHGRATPIIDTTAQRLHEMLGPLLERAQIPVLAGFIAATLEGVTTTLGRGGSDLTAAIVGAALCATKIEIWTDVDGVMTTDPKLCAEARVIRKMSFDEAADLAHAGAKVLHPATLTPAMRANIPVYVLNSKQPQEEGTEILARARTNCGVSAISAKRGIAAVEIEAEQTLDSEWLRTVYAAFDKHSCPVDLMAISPGRMSLLIGSTAPLPAIAAELQAVATLKWENHKALVCLVGKNIRRQPDIASRAFAAVSGIDVRVICQGASDGTLSFLVEESKVAESVQRLHEIFFPRSDAAQDWGGISSAFCQAG